MSSVNQKTVVSRRTLVQGLAVAGVAIAAMSDGLSQETDEESTTTTITSPDIIAVDPSFNDLIQPGTAIHRLHRDTGLSFAEGPAWSAQGRYLVWSDIPNNRQMRWFEDDSRVSVFRAPSNNSNGNTFDFQGRQISCEDLTRRVVRYEHDGTATVLADSYNGKRLNSPNDIVAHPDGSYWFTDPPYGVELDEGKRELPTNCYRIDPSGRIDLVISEDLVPDPNGLAFSPDYKKLYVVSTAKGPGDTGPGGKDDMFVFHVGADNKLTGQKRFSDLMIDGVKCRPDGLRCDANGNLWCSSNAGHMGYSGVTVWTPSGQLIGRIRVPEACANICFGGHKRNRLFMAAGQSLYAVDTATKGAGTG
jgi:gluconolactonase